MQLEIGQEVDGYLIQGVIGRGGMGIVYKAEDVALSREVALKVINPSMSRDEAFVRRFQSEARTLAKINSPNIVAIHAFRKTEHGLFIVMEYVDGGDLSDRMQEGVLSLSRTLSIIKQLLRAFQDAHSAGVVHRDIKPPNIMISRQGEVKVTDFGLAKMSQADMTKTMTQGIIGTLYYMSPEQIQGEEVDQRSDLWSLGVVFYELLTGLRPFDAAYEASVMYAIMNEPLSFPDRFQAELPDEIKTIVARVLEKDRDKRYMDATEMLVDIESFESHYVDTSATRMMPGPSSGAAAKTVASTMPARSKSVPTESRRKKVWWTGGTVLVAIVVIAAYVFYQGSKPPPVNLFSLNSIPDSANVYLAGNLIGMTPIDEHELDSDVENVPVRVELHGYVSVDTVLGAGLFHLLELNPEGTGVEAGDGDVDVAGDAGGANADAVEPPLPPGMFVLRAIPDGAAFVDNRSVPSQESYRTPAGTHTISFRSSTFGTADTTLYVAPGRTKEIVVYFEAAITISTTPSSVVFIDENFVGETPFFGTLGPGTYKVRVEKDGYLSNPPDTTITIEASFNRQLKKGLSFRLVQQ